MVVYTNCKGARKRGEGVEGKAKGKTKVDR